MFFVVVLRCRSGLCSCGHGKAQETAIGLHRHVVGQVCITGVQSLRLRGFLVAVGMGLLGSVAGGVTTSLGTRTSLTPLLIVPLSLPLLLGATQALESLEQGRSILPWLVLLAAVDLALAVSGVLAARPLEEAIT